jgi:hypothetical protein
MSMQLWFLLTFFPVCFANMNRVLFQTQNYTTEMGRNGVDISSWQSVAARFTPIVQANITSYGVWLMANDDSHANVSFTLCEPVSTEDETPNGCLRIETVYVRTIADNWTPIYQVIPSVTKPLVYPKLNYWLIAETSEADGAVWVFTRGVLFASYWQRKSDFMWQRGARSAAFGVRVEGQTDGFSSDAAEAS